MGVCCIDSAYLLNLASASCELQIVLQQVALLSLVPTRTPTRRTLVPVTGGGARMNSRCLAKDEQTWVPSYCLVCCQGKAPHLFLCVLKFTLQILLCLSLSIGSPYVLKQTVTGCLYISQIVCIYRRLFVYIIGCLYISLTICIYHRLYVYITYCVYILPTVRIYHRLFVYISPAVCISIVLLLVDHLKTKLNK